MFSLENEIKQNYSSKLCLWSCILLHNFSFCGSFTLKKVACLTVSHKVSLWATTCNLQVLAGLLTFLGGFAASIAILFAVFRLRMRQRSPPITFDLLPSINWIPLQSTSSWGSRARLTAVVQKVRHLNLKTNLKSSKFNFHLVVKSEQYYCSIAIGIAIVFGAFIDLRVLLQNF